MPRIIQKKSAGESLIQRNTLFPGTAGGLPDVDVRAFWRLGEAINDLVVTDTSGYGNHAERFLKIGPCSSQFRLARNATSDGAPFGNQQFFGSLALVGVWWRLLTTAERMALAGGEGWPFSTTTSLQDCKAFFLLDEATGATTYVDATGRGNDLSVHSGLAGGPVRDVSGPYGRNATNFPVPVGRENDDNYDIYLYFNGPVPEDLQNRPGDYSVALFGKVDRIPTGPGGIQQQVAFGQLDNVGKDSGYNIYCEATTNRWMLDYDAGDERLLDAGSVCINKANPITTGIWQHIITQYDETNNRTGVSVDNGAFEYLENIIQPLPVTGKIGNGSKFQLNHSLVWNSDPLVMSSGWDGGSTPYAPVVGNSNVFIANPNADISFGNNDKYAFGWIQAPDVTTEQTIEGIYGGSAATLDWRVWLYNSRLYFSMGTPITSVSVPYTDTVGFHLFEVWFDTAANEMRLWLDNGAQSAFTTGPATPQTLSVDFRIGSDRSGWTAPAAPTGKAGGGGGQCRDVVCNLFCIANGVPTTSTHDAVWNSGSGWAL